MYSRTRGIHQMLCGIFAGAASGIIPQNPAPARFQNPVPGFLKNQTNNNIYKFTFSYFRKPNHANFHKFAASTLISFSKLIIL